MPIYTLYVKTHNKTGLKYLGRTTQDPYKYKGSGTYWRSHLKKHGNRVGYFSPYRLFSFPTKNSWKQNSDIVLIEQSARHLEIAAGWLNFDRIYMVRPGCSNGKLKWEEVKPVISSYLNFCLLLVDFLPV